VDGDPGANGRSRSLAAHPWVVAVVLIVGALVGGIPAQAVRVLRGGHADWSIVLGMVVGATIVGVPLSMWLRWADRPPRP